MKDFNKLEKMCMDCHKQMAEPGGICEFCDFDNDSPKSPHHLPPRTILAGKYMTGRVLGEGGFGITYIGYDLNLDCTVAIKEYYPAGFVSRETTVRNTVTFLVGMNQDYYKAGMEKFLNEAKALAKFSELPGIVRVRDFFRENGTAYIAMDYIEGNTLAQELEKRGGRIPAAEVLNKMDPLIRSLSVVHNSGVIHRDISPDNIMQNKRGELKLLDFGAAKVLSSDSKSVSVMLKPGYAPEEQYRTQGEQGPWTDCYALCATIYKLITGVTPQESLERMADDRLVPPSRLGATISPVVEQALLMGLAVKAENRFRSMEALYNALYAEGVPYYDKGGNESVIAGAPASSQKTIPIHQSGTFNAPNNPPASAPYSQQRGTFSPPVNQTPKKKKPVALFAGLGVLAVGAIVALVILLKPGPSTQVLANSPNPSPATEINETPSPTPSSFAGAFNTPALLPEETMNLPGGEGLTLGSGTISLPDFELFTGLRSTNEYSNQSGDNVKQYRYDISSLVGYLEVLYGIDGITIGETGEENNLFYVQQSGGAYQTFDYADGLLEVVTPAEAYLSPYDPGVAYLYLQNNGLTYTEWLSMGSLDYNYRGINYRGNTAANILNGSCVAVQGRYMYYCDYSDTGYIYKMDFDTNEIEPVLDQAAYAMHINVQGDYVYFTSYNSDDDTVAIYRCDAVYNPDSLYILRDNATMPYVVGNYIYFRDLNDSSLRRMDLLGQNEQIVVASSCYFVNPTASGFYASDVDGVGIFWIDGQNLTATKISNEDVYQMILCGNYIYYSASDTENSYIYRIYYDGSGERELICEMSATELNWDGEDIYFVGKYDSCLYRVPQDGGEAIKMAEGAVSPTVCAGDDYVMVFYYGEGGASLMAYNWATGESGAFPF